MNNKNTLVSVAVGVILRGDNVFLAKRPSSVHLGGLWEFPGGKVDGKESVEQALIRELHEELGLTLVQDNLSHQFDIDWQYAEKRVLLNVYTVTNFAGDPVGAEGQDVAWVNVKTLADYPLPEANAQIVTWLQENERFR